MKMAGIMYDIHIFWFWNIKTIQCMKSEIRCRAGWICQRLNTKQAINRPFWIFWKFKDGWHHALCPFFYILKYKSNLAKGLPDIMLKHAVLPKQNLKNGYKTAILDFLKVSKWRASCLISILSYSKIWEWSSDQFVWHSAKHAVLAKKNAKNGHKSAILNFFKNPKRRASSGH